MHVLISGICGFVGSTIAEHLAEQPQVTRVGGFDNLARSGSWTNRQRLRQRGIEVRHADCRIASDIDTLPKADWVIDAAATPSVLAGVGSGTSSRQLTDTNLQGTLHLLEYCKSHSAGFVLLSSSRVYSISALKQLPLVAGEMGFELETAHQLPPGMSSQGVQESFSTAAPISLYGATKLSSELLAREYSLAFGFPVQINRCGVLAGAGQFGRADQGIFAYWLHSWRERAELRYLGFQGSGWQTRDCLHPRDLAELIYGQMRKPAQQPSPVVNVSGGISSAMSLRQLSEWCQGRWGEHTVAAEKSERVYDVPWLVLDSATARSLWEWKPRIGVQAILEEIAEHADAHPDWLQLSRS